MFERLIEAIKKILYEYTKRDEAINLLFKIKRLIRSNDNTIYDFKKISELCDSLMVEHDEIWTNRIKAIRQH